MLQLKPLDPSFSIERQIGIETGPVILVNIFTLNRADEAATLAAWTDDARVMQRQPGFISTQLHRAIGDSCIYLNYAVWNSSSAFRAAFSHPDFTSSLSRYPSSVVATPHLFRKIAVPGICAT